MKYWVYSSGQIYGPLETSALPSTVPGFSPHSLVCPEGVSGETPGDWCTAESVKELASLLLACVSATSASGAARTPAPSPTAEPAPPSPFVSEPDWGPLLGTLPSTGFSFESLPGILRETPAETSMNEQVKTYLQELNLKDRHILSLEDELKEAQGVFERYHSEIARILDENKRTFEQVHQHLTRKDLALEQASKKITTLEESLHLVVRPDQTLSETILQFKKESDQLHQELAQVRSELAQYKEKEASAAAPKEEVKPPEEVKKEPEPQKGFKLGLKLGGIKPIGLGAPQAPGAKGPLLKTPMGSRPTLGLKLPSAPLKGLPAPEEKPKPLEEAKPPVSEAAKAPPVIERPADAALSTLPAVQKPAEPASPAPLQAAQSATPAAPAVPERPSLPPMEMLFPQLEIPLPSWETTAPAPIELILPKEAVSETPVPEQPAQAPETAGTLKAVESIFEAAAPATTAPPSEATLPFTLKKKTFGAPEAAPHAAPSPGELSAAKPLRFALPAEPAEKRAEVPKAAEPSAKTEVPAVPIPALPTAPKAEPLPFKLAKKTLETASGAPVAPASKLADGKVLKFTPPSAAPQPILGSPATAPAAWTPITLIKKTLGQPEHIPAAPGAAPSAKTLSFIAPQSAVQPAAATPSPGTTLAPGQAPFTLTKKTLGTPEAAPATPSAPTGKPVSFAPPAAPAVPQTPASLPFALKRKTLEAASGAPSTPEKGMKPASRPLNFIPSPAAPAVRPEEAVVVVHPDVPTGEDKVQAPGPLPETAAPQAKAAPAEKMPIQFAPSTAPVVEQAEAAAQAPETTTESLKAPPRSMSPLEEAIRAFEQPKPPELKEPPAQEAPAQLEAKKETPQASAWKNVSSVSAEIELPAAEIAKPAEKPVEPISPVQVPAPLAGAVPIPAVEPVPPPMKAAEPPASPTPAASAVPAVPTVAPAKKAEPVIVRPAPAAAPAAEAAPERKTKRTSRFAVYAVVGLLVIGSVVTALLIFKDINDIGIGPVVTMPEATPPEGGANFSLPAPNPAQQAPAPAQPSPGTPSQMTVPGVTAPQGPPVSQVPDRIAEPIQEAIRFVKTYQLDPSRGSIANWFDIQYLTSPGDGKQAEWSAVHLEDSKFTVQFRLSYPARQQQLPEIYYVFEVDLAAKTIQGRNESSKALLDGGKSASRAPKTRPPEAAAGTPSAPPAGIPAPSQLQTPAAPAQQQAPQPQSFLPTPGAQQQASAQPAAHQTVAQKSP